MAQSVRHPPAQQLRPWACSSASRAVDHARIAPKRERDAAISKAASLQPGRGGHAGAASRIWRVTPCISLKRQLDRMYASNGARKAVAHAAVTFAPEGLELMSEERSNSTLMVAEAAGVAAGRQLRMPSAEELAGIQLPALTCSFDSLLHPHYQQVRAECDQWIEKVAQLPSVGARRFLRDCLLPRLVCRFIPHALRRRRLLHVIKLIAWLMIADDDDDNPELLGSDYASTSHRAAHILAILNAPHHHHHHHRQLSERSSNQLDALADLWQEMWTDMSPLLRSRFISSMADYLEGIKMQAALRVQLCVPSMESYMKIRLHASFTIPAFIMVEYASGIELDQATVEDARVVELLHKAVDYISLCNDIFSCYKEISIGDYFNLPSILYTCSIPIGTSTRPYPSFQDAIDHVAHLAQDLDTSCTSLITSLKEEASKPSIEPAKAYHIRAYADAIGFGMSGALAWFFETPRYPQPCTKHQLY